MPSAWTSQSFYPINPIEEKENTMQFKISRNQISNQIKKIEESSKRFRARRRRNKAGGLLSRL